MKKLLFLVSLFLFPFSVFGATSAKIMVVAGGGGGGSANGGGGGGGGYIYNTNYPITAGSYSVVIGNGGDAGVNGENSIFNNDLTAIGGGAGGRNYSNGSNGGSGGGGGGDNGTGGSASQGNNGGNGSIPPNYPSGGGGGAGSSGVSGSGTQSGFGGNGISNQITGFSILYAGGGGGGATYNLGDTAGSGGSGGGGNGASDIGSGSSGTVNTGGGGGGGNDGGGAGSGGKGIIIIAYKTVDFSHTGGNDTGINGSETWVKFTSSGTLVLTALTPPPPPVSTGGGVLFGRHYAGSGSDAPATTSTSLLAAVGMVSTNTFGGIFPYLMLTAGVFVGFYIIQKIAMTLGGQEAASDKRKRKK